MAFGQTQTGMESDCRVCGSMACRKAPSKLARQVCLPVMSTHPCCRGFCRHLHRPMLVRSQASHKLCRVQYWRLNRLAACHIADCRCVTKADQTVLHFAGSGSAFVSIQIGYVQNRRDKPTKWGTCHTVPMTAGNVAVECSTSGVFFRGFPYVSPSSEISMSAPVVLTDLPLINLEQHWKHGPA